MVESPFLPPQAVMSWTPVSFVCPVVWSLAPALVPWKEPDGVPFGVEPGMEKAT